MSGQGGGAEALLSRKFIQLISLPASPVLPWGPISERNVLRLAVFGFLLFLSACSHTITYVPVAANRGHGEGTLVVTIPSEVSKTVVDQRIGLNVDLWKIEVGPAIAELLPQTLSSEFASVSVVIADSKDLKVNLTGDTKEYLCIQSVNASIETGTTRTGAAEMEISVDVHYIDATGNALFRREFSASGPQSGPDQLQSWQDSYQFNSYGKGVERALGHALTEAVLRVSKSIADAIKQKKLRPQGEQE